MIKIKSYKMKLNFCQEMQIKDCDLLSRESYVKVLKQNQILGSC